MGPHRGKPEASVKLPVGLPPAQYEWLREHAFRRRVPMAEVIREALGELQARDVRHPVEQANGEQSD